MKIKIGAAEYSAARPKDLDEQLIAVLGLSAAEVAEQLAGDPLLSSVARALRPFLGADAPSAGEVAAAIDPGSRPRVLRQVRQLYASAKRKELPDAGE